VTAVPKVDSTFIPKTWSIKVATGQASVFAGWVVVRGFSTTTNVSWASRDAATGSGISTGSPLRLRVDARVADVHLVVGADVLQKRHQILAR
jgi:hypothetical protein